MKHNRMAARVRCVSLRGASVGLVISALFFLLGILLGHAAAQRCAEPLGEELSRYLASYPALRAERAASPAAILGTLGCFFRAPTAIFLLGFASLGVLLIPCVCALQGFLFAFSLFCFSSALGQGGFFALTALFAPRLFVVLPCTLLLAGAAMESSCALASLSLGRGKRVKGIERGWLRFGKVCVCLLLGAMAELWLAARILPLLR